MGEEVERLKRDLELQDGGGVAYTCQDALYTVVVQGEDLRTMLATLDRVDRERDENRAIAEQWADAHDELGLKLEAAEAQVEALMKALEEIADQAERHRISASHSIWAAGLDWVASKARQAALSAPAEESVPVLMPNPSVWGCWNPDTGHWRKGGFFDAKADAIAFAERHTDNYCRLVALPLFVRVNLLATVKAEESGSQLAWPFAFYDSHTAAERLETLAKLFEQTVEDKLTGRVSIAAPERAAADIRGVLAEIERLTPKPSPHEHLTSAVYRAGPVTAEMYDEAIEDLQNAKRALVEGDSMGCRVCEDSGHGANMCHHNPLLLARKWTAATRLWQCFHCGYIATNDEEGREHFGRHEDEDPACLRAAQAEARSEQAEGEA